VCTTRSKKKVTVARVVRKGLQKKPTHCHFAFIWQEKGFGNKILVIGTDGNSRKRKKMQKGGNEKMQMPCVSKCSRGNRLQRRQIMEQLIG